MGADQILLWDVFLSRCMSSSYDVCNLGFMFSCLSLFFHVFCIFEADHTVHLQLKVAITAVVVVSFLVYMCGILAKIYIISETMYFQRRSLRFFCTQNVSVFHVAPFDFCLVANPMLLAFLLFLGCFLFF